MFSRKQTKKAATRDVDFVRDSKMALASTTTHVTKLTLYLILAIILTTFWWAYSYEIDVPTVATGRIMSISNLQIIQNIDGGIIASINVKSGETVKRGQILATLDTTRAESKYQRDRARQAVLETDAIRLSAESGELGSLTFPKSLRKNYPELVHNAKILFSKNKASLAESLKLMRQNYDLIHSELKMIRPLVQQGAMSQIEQLRLERELLILKSSLNDREQRFRENARTELKRVQASIAILNEQIKESEDKVKRKIIRSPIDGVVNKLHIGTIGQVIASGQNIMEIVPGDRNLVALIKVRPEQIGFIKLGQPATIKVSAYDFSIYGTMTAKITKIGADALLDAQGNSYYEVSLEFEKNYIETPQEKLALRPGMTLTANILTAKRNLLSYLIKPFVQWNELTFVSQ